MNYILLAVFAIAIPATVLSHGNGYEDGNLPDPDRIKPSQVGYVMIGEPIQLPNGVRVDLQRAEGTMRQYDGEAEFLTFTAEFPANRRLRIKITDDTNRWEVPLKINPPRENNTDLQYDITFSNDPLFSFKVVRKSTGAVLLDAAGNNGQFIFAEQFLTLSWKPPTENVYGIGENEQPTFKHDFSKNLTWALWARDQPPDFTANMYGVQPYYTVLEADGKAHSVAIVNSNAQQFAMLPGPLITYTTIGGLLDFYIFLGPYEGETVQLYTQAVGRAQIPPYWALGFQLSRSGYNSIENMKAAVNRTAQYNIPHDVQYGDIDIMERGLDFTYSEERFPGLPDYIRELKGKGIKFMTVLDPYISIGEPVGSYEPYDLGMEMDVWMKRPDGTNAVGKGIPEHPVHFADYSNPRTKEWWKSLIVKFHDLLEYDGLSINSNEPTNLIQGDIDGCPNNQWNNPPFVPSIREGNLASMTVCPHNRDYAGRHYDTHSLYGWFQSEPTLVATRAGTGKRGLVLSRSTFLGSGHWAGHLSGDNWSRWNNLHLSIIRMLQFNQFGIPFVGSNICGSIGDSTAELCQRWMQLGAFYPFARNHNGLGYRDQDPGSWGPEIADSSRRVLETRYTLLPYLYTLFYYALNAGSAVARPLGLQFPDDATAASIDRQFLWGSDLLISPVLEEGATNVTAYIPNARVYSYYTGDEIASRGQYVTIQAPLDFIPLHVLGGSIIPTQIPAINTQISRNNPMGLIIALDDAGFAIGGLYFDDGDSIDPVQNGAHFFTAYSVMERRLVSSVWYNGYPGMASKKIETIRLMGAGEVTNVTVNGVIHSDFSASPSGEVLMRNLGIQANTFFVVEF